MKSFDEIRRLLYQDQQPSVQAFAASTPVEGYEEAVSFLGSSGMFWCFLWSF
jgi:hypothetical protein